MRELIFDAAKELGKKQHTIEAAQYFSKATARIVRQK
jgi:hypothetical protein